MYIYGLLTSTYKVTLLIEQNYYLGIHIAIFIVHKSTHRQFDDDHTIQIEISDQSQTYKNIERLLI